MTSTLQMAEQGVSAGIPTPLLASIMVPVALVILAPLLKPWVTLTLAKLRARRTDSFEDHCAAVAVENVYMCRGRPPFVVSGANFKFVSTDTPALKAARGGADD